MIAKAAVKCRGNELLFLLNTRKTLSSVALYTALQLRGIKVLVPNCT